MIRLAAILCLFAGAAQGAAVLPPQVWHGPGPRACNGACGLDWALSELPVPREVAQRLTEMTTANPAGSPMEIESGDRFAMMSYAVDGTPLADRRETLAVLPAPEPARGWV
ncbi:MAG: hypothetical protein AAGI70_16810, partial [Pseudomonadota bacterium]